jgi:hypothetical protein
MRPPNDRFEGESDKTLLSTTGDPEAVMVQEHVRDQDLCIWGVEDRPALGTTNVAQVLQFTGRSTTKAPC